MISSPLCAARLGIFLRCDGFMLDLIGCCAIGGRGYRQATNDSRACDNFVANLMRSFHCPDRVVDIISQTTPRSSMDVHILRIFMLELEITTAALRCALGKQSGRIRMGL